MENIQEIYDYVGKKWILIKIFIIVCWVTRPDAVEMAVEMKVIGKRGRGKPKERWSNDND